MERRGEKSTGETKTEGFGSRDERCFSSKMSLTVDVIPEIVTGASEESGKLLALSSINRLAARSFPSIINLAKRRANCPEDGAVRDTADGRWCCIDRHSCNKLSKSPFCQHLRRLSKARASSLDLDLKFVFCNRRIGINIAAFKTNPSRAEQSAKD